MLTEPHTSFLEQLRDALFPEWTSPSARSGPSKLYARAARTLEKIMPDLRGRTGSAATQRAGVRRVGPDTRKCVTATA